ncbi:MAG: hypothetical protein VKO39_05870, partial [Cyanobacteriota bacterium]|nr:hypothetical protein [Cyanobacteriota bacterium]
MSTLTLTQALDELRNNPRNYASVKALYKLAGKLSVHAEGKITVIFSGETIRLDEFGKPFFTTKQLVEGIKESGVDIRQIGATDASKFLESSEFKASLGALYGLDARDLESRDGELSPEKIKARSLMNDSLYHPKAGPWAEASGRFSRETKGSVIAICAGAQYNRILGQTELPSMLTRKEISDINGIPRVDLTALGPERAFEAVKSQSVIALSEVEIATNPNGSPKLNNGVPVINASRALEMFGLASDPRAMRPTNTMLLARFMDINIENYRSGSNAIKDIQQKYRLAGAMNVLDKIGWAGDLLALGFTVSAANAAYAKGDTAGGDKIINDWAIDFTGGLAGGLLASQLTSAALAPLFFQGPAGFLIASGLTLLAGIFGGVLGSFGLGYLIETFSEDTGSTALAGTVIPRRDPLLLDLDGDGIETRGRQDQLILFDHDADGVKTGTGWVKPDDGWLVLDRNRNGSIDSGRELFGIDSLKDNGQMAADGFDALRDFDANSDGKIDANDRIFGSLRIWRDLNQDGISQSDEITTLLSNGIISIGVTSIPVRTDLGNGNLQTASGTFLRSNGATGTTGETNGAAANLDLLVNSFYRQFTDHIPLSDQAKGLPNVRGSGRVRDLREAISLSPDLGNLVHMYTQQKTRQGQVDLLDAFLEKWAKTSDLKPLSTQADALRSNGVNLVYDLIGLTAGTAAYEDFVHKLGIVERFMGFTYGGTQGQALFTPLDATSGEIIVTMQPEQIDNIMLAYDKFKTNLYEGLLSLTRHKEYFDKISIRMVDRGLGLDFRELESDFRRAIKQNARKGIIDLIEFISSIRSKGNSELDWNSTEFLLAQLEEAPDLEAFKQELSYWVVHISGATERKLFGTSRRDLLVGSTNTDELTGLNEDDILLGRGDSDHIHAGNGDDLLVGGKGNDSLYGGAGADTYRYALGDGTDTLSDETDDDSIDHLIFSGTGLTAANAIAKRVAGTNN